MERKILNYIAENNLEVNGLISFVDLEKVAKKFDTTILNVMYILRTRSQYIDSKECECNA